MTHSVDQKSIVKCILESGFDDLATSRKRKKRSASTDENKYGCPDNFQRVTNDVCLHYRSNSSKEKIFSSFDSSRNYCKNIFNKASLLFIDNAIEAIEIWKWIGKCEPVFHDIISIYVLHYTTQLHNLFA